MKKKLSKKMVIGAIIGGVGTAALCALAYRTGLRHGSVMGIGTCMAMLNADRDGTLMITEYCLSDLSDDEYKEIVAYGNELVQNGIKNMESA